MFRRARILVAPLDWGLGHATRCIPIIRRLIEHDAVPIIGANGAPLELLLKEFTQLEHVRIPGTPISYSSGNDQTKMLMRQFPRMLIGLRKESRIAQVLVKQLALDAIISDQRFGVRSAAVPSVLITHQIFPRTPIMQRTLQQINSGMIGKFDRCWIMDEAEAPGLAGDLSHGKMLPMNTRYIGVHSRFATEGTSIGKKHRIVALLSGPEPQRSKLERILLEQLQHIEGSHVLVQGTINAKPIEIRGNISIIPFTTADRTSELVRSAELVVARSGYTTIMDLSRIGAKALLIPTPGQPEQEYLADLHGSGSRSLTADQDHIDLKNALERSGELRPVPIEKDDRKLHSALTELAGMIRRPSSA